MKTIIVLLLLISSFPVETLTQFVWARRYDGPVHNLDYAKDIKIRQYDVYVAGSSWGNNTNTDFTVVKYNIFGAFLWDYRYNSPDSGSDNAMSVTVDQPGNIYVTGMVNHNNTTGTDIFTISLTPAGGVRWIKEFTGSGNGTDNGIKVMTDNAGNVYVLGVTTSGAGDFDIVVIKYSGLGNVIWSRQYESPQTQIPNDMYVDKITGDVYVTGYTGNFLPDYLTLRLNPQGVIQWTRLFGGTASQEDVSNSIGHNIQNGDVYITGKCQNKGTGVGITSICYDINGGQKWISRFDSPIPGGSTEGYDIEYAGEIIYVSGWGNISNLQQHMGIVLGLETNGQLKWSKSYAGRTGNFTSQNAPSDMKIDPFGNAHIAATGFDSAFGIGRNFMYVMANSLGYLRIHEYNSTTSDFTSAIDINGYRAVITGSSDTTGHSSDMLTAAFVNKGNSLTNMNPKNISSFSTEWDSITAPVLGVFGDASNVISVKVTLDTIIFPQDGDLEIYLQHNGITDTLVYHNGGTGDNFISTEFDDTASVHINNGTSPFTGSFKPKSPLSVFNSGEVSGLWLLKIKNTGAFTGILRSWTITFEIDENTIGIQPVSNEIPNKYCLYQNYPNPFNPVTNIKFNLPNTGLVTLKVYDITGREVAQLVNQNMNQGTYTFDFDASHLSTGAYFYRLSANGFTDVKKMMLIK